MAAKEDFVERYRHVLRSILLDGLLKRDREEAATMWRRLDQNARKIDEILARIFDELTKKETRNEQASGNGQPGTRPAGQAPQAGGQRGIAETAEHSART